ncbi:50S ribosomal protein L5 [Candidatus Giovannonibacteria bacterium]|nr:50S ribosomal protein L5 [Candidatus Giovannonibacteria bacterium]
MADYKTKFEKQIVGKIMKERGLTSPLAVTRLTKIVINTGVGKLKDDKEKEIVKKYLTMISGQEVHARPAKKSIASFKSREGMTIGYSVTLRGQRMYDFLTRLIDVALPRSRDFRGISETSVDQFGNLTIGIREHIAFPEIIGEDVKTIFGLEATLVTSAKNKEEALELYRALGIPFKK